MAGPQKIATCCYCGTRAALVFRGETRHELTCSNCGAPLHALKALPSSPKKPSKKRKQDRIEAISHRPKPKKRKRKSRFWEEFFDEALDLLEDVLD